VVSWLNNKKHQISAAHHILDEAFNIFTFRFNTYGYLFDTNNDDDKTTDTRDRIIYFHGRYASSDPAGEDKKGNEEASASGQT
jgi:hypothetical protein